MCLASLSCCQALHVSGYINFFMYGLIWFCLDMLIDSCVFCNQL